MLFTVYEFKRIGRLYSRMPSKLLQHSQQIFFPWAEWDWSQDTKLWALVTAASDVWISGPHGLGGNGVLPCGCVRNGPFQENHFSTPEIDQR